jgi:pyruvate/2-oxoglutarate dehydrogenase complex dihydrolipoamide dehydrogenase (E3) component
VLGCEFASLYRYFQSKIILIEKNARLLKFMDEQVSNAVEKHLKEIGVEMIFNATIEHVSKGEVIIELHQTNVRRTVTASLVICCNGQKPKCDYAKFEKLGIEMDADKATIVIDEQTCQTSVPNIYACGGVVSSCWSWVSLQRDPCVCHSCSVDVRFLVPYVKACRQPMRYASRLIKH